MSMRPIIALIGRPNVGKSVLFNRLVGQRQAITSHQSGTTRDRHYGLMEWFGHAWTLVDTGGLAEPGPESDESGVEASVKDQTTVAIEEATVIAFVVNIQEGITRSDEAIVAKMRAAGKPVVLLVNKVDNGSLAVQAHEFSRLGIEPLFPVSGLHGRGLGDFAEWLIKHFPALQTGEDDTKASIAVIGRPNVGKSSLVNALAAQERMIVSHVPGTTRDSVATDIVLADIGVTSVVDTAGIRRRGKTEQGVESFALFRALRAINRASCVVLVLTIEENPARQDAHVASYAIEAGKSVIVALNKTDLAAENIFRLSPNEQKKRAEHFLRRFPFIQRLPVVFVSAQTKQGIADLQRLVTQQLPQKTAKPDEGYMLGRE